MKRCKRLLAMLLAAMILTGTWSAVADSELEIDLPETVPGNNLVIDLASPADIPEAMAELDGIPAPDDLEISELQLESAPSETASNESNHYDEDDVFDEEYPAPGLYEYDEWCDETDYCEDHHEISQASIHVGDQLELIVIFAGENPVTWSSSNTAVASVSDGTVTAIDVGTCTITARAGSWTGSCDISVSDPAGLYEYDHWQDDEDYSEQIKSAVLDVGDTLKLYVTYTNGRSVTWSSSDTAVASVSDGTVTAIDAGTCTITARAGSWTGSCDISVSDPAGLYEYDDWRDDEDYDEQIESAALDVGDTLELYVTYTNGRTVTWSSSDTTVATVSDGTVTTIDAGTCTITARAGNWTGSCDISVFDPAGLYEYDDWRDDEDYDEQIESASLDVGETLELYVTYTNGRTVTWSSSNTGVATVNNGTVTAKNRGDCKITAKVGKSTALSCSITVFDPSEISDSKLALNVGQKQKLTIDALHGRPVTWSSSDSRVATVDNGTVTAVKAGSCTITAKIANGNSFDCRVTVSDPAMLSKTSLSLNVGKAFKLTVSSLVGRSVSWSSSDAAIATVKEGTVTAVKAGSCTITAKVENGKKLTCKITVSDSARLSKKALSLKAGNTVRLKVSNLAGRNVAWSSSDARIAAVKSGSVTAFRAGKCTITAQIKGGKKLTCKVTVTDPAKLSNVSLNLGLSEVVKLKVTNLAGRKVVWSSSNNNVARVKNGTVTGVSSGKCVITVQIKNGKKLTCKVAVTDKARLSRVSLSLKIGKAARLKVNNLAGRSVVWSSSDRKVATVKDGTVTAVNAGRCIITAQINNGKKLTCKVAVTDGAKLSDSSLSLEIGKAARLTVNNLARRTVTWTSSDEDIATVKAGTVTAVKAGKCTITAQIKNGRKLTCKVTVTDPAKLSKSSLTLLEGKSATLSVSGLLGRKVTWSTSNRKVATVTRGRVKAEAAGACKIIANLGNKKLICNVTVEKPLTGDIQGILGKNMYSINRRLPDKLRYFDDDAYTNDYFLVQTDEDDDIIAIALLTDASSGIGKYTLYGLYPGMTYDKACDMLNKKGWKLETESYSEAYFYNPKNGSVSFYVTIEDDCIDLVMYLYN